MVGLEQEHFSQSLQGSLVLVTGGAKRVGRAIASLLAQHGAQVAIHCHRSIQEATALAADIGNRSFVVSANLQEPDDIHRLFDHVLTQAKKSCIDHLVNNAAIFARTPFLQTDLQQWQTFLQVNFLAPMICSQHAVQAGAKTITNLLDIAAWQPWAEYAAYSSSKAALLQATRVLAKELAPRVRVNAIAPGTLYMPTEGDDVALVQNMQPRIPLQTLGSPTDIAQAVYFFLTQPFVTGICLPIDGGQSLR